MALGKIAAFYQCYKNRDQVDFVLSNYRKIYSDTNCILICDGGDDFSTEAKKFKCKYFYEEKIETRKNLIFESTDSARIFINRFLKALEYIDEDYFILLEDDVYIIKEINSSLEHEINGCNTNEFFSEKITQILNEKNNKSDVSMFYGAFGGCILNTFFFKKLSRYQIDTTMDVYLKNTDINEWASDKLISFLCLYNKGNIGHYSGLVETWYSNYQARIQKCDVEVIHKYRK